MVAYAVTSVAILFRRFCEGRRGWAVRQVRCDFVRGPERKPPTATGSLLPAAGGAQTPSGRAHATSNPLAVCPRPLTSLRPLTRAVPVSVSEKGRRGGGRRRRAGGGHSPRSRPRPAAVAFERQCSDRALGMTVVRKSCQGLPNKTAHEPAY
jgi:hypothetical protein